MWSGNLEMIMYDPWHITARKNMFATSLRLEVGPLPQNARFALRAIFENKVESTTSDLWNILLRGMFGQFDALIYVLNYMDHFGNVLQNETLCRLSIRLFCNMI